MNTQKTSYQKLDYSWIDRLNSKGGECRIHEGTLPPNAFDWIKKLSDIESPVKAMDIYGTIIDLRSKAKLTEYGSQKSGLLTIYPVGQSTYVKKKA